MAKLTLQPSPLRVLDRALHALNQDWGRPLAALTVFYLIPYVAGYFVLYAPMIDAAGNYDGGAIATYGRYYGYIAWFFVLQALSLCTTGRLIHQTLKGAPLTSRQVAREAPGLWLRSLPVYLIVAVATYLGNYAWVVPGMFVSLIAAFLLPAFALERQTLTAALKSGWALCRGRFVILALNIALITAYSQAAQWAIGQANARFSIEMSFAAASILVQSALALVQMVQMAFLLSLFACVRDQTKPPHQVAEVFD